jgi:outer membrane protein OmpA-like peptidoglycan-associated protein
MSRQSHAFLLACFLAGVCAAVAPSFAAAQSATLAPPAERISDSVIQQDYAAYERMQARIKGLNDGGRRVADYHLAKAQCWLDVSFHEYTRNDRSAFPQAAMTESEKLVAAMEARAEPLPDETPLVNGAARLRPDLWARLQGLKDGAGFVCAAQKAACAEVELVHAGNEFNQQQWRHAKPYVQIAEDEIAEAQSLASQCAAPVVASAAPAPLVAAVPAVAETRFVLSTALVFDFDRSAPADIRSAGREQLESMLRKVDAEHLHVVSVRLVGHADRLNGTGDRAYNQALSERRAATVRELLVAHGIDGRSIETSALGDTVPVEACRSAARSVRDLEECLLPNRRVEVELTAIR